MGKPYRIIVVTGGFLLISDYWLVDMFPSIAAAMDHVCNLRKLRAT